MKIKFQIVTLILALSLAFLAVATFQYAYSVDNNCKTTLEHTALYPIVGGCIEDRLDALENAGAGSDATSASNLGTGAGVFAQEVVNDLQFKSAKGSPDISVTSDATSFTIDYNGTVASESTSCGNVGTGKLIHITSSNCNAKSIKGSPDISVTNDSSTVIIDFNGTDNNSCTNTGTGEPICESANNINSLIATSPITVSDTTGDLTIACSTCITTSSTNAFLQLDKSVAGVSGGNVWLQQSGANTNVAMDNTNKAVAEHLGASSALVGGVANFFSVSLLKTASPTGTLFACTLDSSNNCVYTFGSIDVSTLTTTATMYSFYNNAGTVTLASGDRLGVKYTNGDATNKVSIATSATDVYDTTNSARSIYTSSWQADTTNDLGSTSSTQFARLDYILLDTDFTATKHLFFTVEARITSNTMNLHLVFNNDYGLNYANRFSISGASDSTVVSALGCEVIGVNSFASGDVVLIQGWIDNNISTDRKMVTGTVVYGGSTNSATAPAKAEFSCKWDNTSAQISEITVIYHSTGGLTGKLNTDSVLTIWGYD